MSKLILTVCSLFFLLLSAYGIYFGAVSLCCLLRRRPAPPADRQLRFAVLAAARNEEGCIAGLVESIKSQNYPPELVDIYVIPNNCTDDTAGAAAAAGAKILPVSPAVRSKGQALHDAFALLLEQEKHDAYCVFDADNEADPNFLAEMNRALCSARVAKSRILAKNAHEGWVCACYETFFCNANLFLNRARGNIGLSARVIGTGFAVRRDLMEELGGWNTETLTEDAEFYAILSARGEKTVFVPGAVTYDEEPLSFRESLVQRRRWMSGIMEVCRRKAGSLLRSIPGKGRLFALDSLIQLTFSRLQAWIIPVFLLQVCADPTVLCDLPSIALRYYITTLLIGGVSLLAERRLTRHTAPALLLYPLFIFSFVLLQSFSLLRPNDSWTPIRHTGVRLQRPVNKKQSPG